MTFPPLKRCTIIALQVLPLPEYADFGRRRSVLAPSKEDAVDGDASVLARTRRFDVNKFKIHKVGG